MLWEQYEWSGSGFISEDKVLQIESYFLVQLAGEMRITDMNGHPVSH